LAATEIIQVGEIEIKRPAGIETIRDDMNPQRGIELSLNEHLSGKGGWRISEVDKIRRELVSDEMRESPVVNAIMLSSR